MTDTMRSVGQRVLGGPEVLEILEVPRPEPGPGEVLVRVRAASVNPVDWKVRAGAAPLFGPPPFLHGFDLSGVVERVGPGVDRFRPGDEVYGMRSTPSPRPRSWPRSRPSSTTSRPQHSARSV